MELKDIRILSVYLTATVLEYTYTPMAVSQRSTIAQDASLKAQSMPCQIPSVIWEVSPLQNRGIPGAAGPAFKQA